MIAMRRRDGSSIDEYVLEIADGERYFVTSIDRGSTVHIVLTPYSCLRSMGLLLEQNDEYIRVMFQGRIIYEGNIGKVIEELEKMYSEGKLRLLEVATIYRVLKEYLKRRRKTGLEERKDLEIVYNVFYGDEDEVKRALEEIENHYEDPERAIEKILEEAKRMGGPVYEAVKEKIEKAKEKKKKEKKEKKKKEAKEKKKKKEVTV